MFLSLMGKYEVSQKFMDFLVDQNVKSTDSFAILAGTESEVKDEIIKVAKGAGVPFDKLSDKVSVKKLWKACKSNVKSSEEASSSSLDAPLPKDTEIDIKTLWEKTHGFIMPEDWLLVESLQGKIWRDVHSSPPKLDTILVEASDQCRVRTRVWEPSLP